MSAEDTSSSARKGYFVAGGTSLPLMAGLARGRVCLFCANPHEFWEKLIIGMAIWDCPWGRARQKKYGVKPNQPLPPESTQPR